MRFVFFFLVFTFNYVFYAGMPLYILVIPFISSGFKKIFDTYLRDKNVRSIVKAVFIHSLLITFIHTIHGEITSGIFQIFIVNIVALILGIYMYQFAKDDLNFIGHKYLLVIFILNCIVAILQRNNFLVYWQLPELINSFFQGSITYDGMSDNLGYGKNVRVRGLFLYIHKFSPAILALSVFFYFKAYYANFKTFYWVIASIMLFTAILTQTRSIFLGLIIGGVVALLIFIRKKLKIILGIILTSIIFYSFLISVKPVVFERMFTSNTNELAYTDIYRLMGINFSLEKFFNSPVIGSLDKLIINGFDSVTVHSVIIRILGDYGIIGLLSYISMILVVLNNLYTGASNNFRTLFTLILGIFMTDSFLHSSGFLFYDLFQFTLIMMLYGYSKNKNFVNT